MPTNSAKLLEEMYLQHIDRSKRLAFLITGDAHQAEDIAQDAFARIAARFQGLPKPEDFEGYLRTTIVNLSRSHLRRLGTQRKYLRAQKGSSEPIHADLDTSRVEEMWTDLNSLSPRQRAALVLRYYEDLSEQQSAEALGVSLPALKSLVSRGLAKLRDERPATHVERMRGHA